MPALATVQVRTIFSPFEDTTAEFILFVGAAQRSIYVCIYGYHLPALTDLLIAKHQAGVTVELILDHTQAAGCAERSEVQRLIDAKIPLLIGTSPVHHQILHSKFTVVDEEAVEFGSWNYSLSASQQSNTMTEVRHADYAAVFLNHFDRLRSFILLSEMALQPKGEVVPEVALPEDAALDQQPARPVDAHAAQARVDGKPHATRRPATARIGKAKVSAASRR